MVSSAKRTLLVFCMVVLAAALAPAQGRAATDDDKALIRRCIALAQSAVAKGNQPFGALLVKDGKVVMTSENTVMTDKNALHHAETNLIAAAFREYGPGVLKGATLYTSCEPCPMCCGAIYMVGIGRVVFGMSAKRLSAMSGWVNTIDARRFFSLSEHEVRITGPVLEEEAADVMADYLEKFKKSEQTNTPSP